MNVMQPGNSAGVGGMQQAAAAPNGVNSMPNRATAAAVKTGPTLVNTIQFSDLLKVAEELGAQDGAGKDTQVKFMLKAVEAGYHGAVSLSPNSRGAGIDDAAALAEAYYKSRSGSNVFDHKAGNQRKLSAIVRTSIKLGMWPKGGNGEPIATVNQLMSQRQQLKKDPAQAKKLQDATNTLMSYARQQLKRDTLIDGDELKSFCYKKEPDDRTVTDVLESTVKKLDALISGKNGLQCNTKNTVDARDRLRHELVNIAKGVTKV